MVCPQVHNYGNDWLVKRFLALYIHRRSFEPTLPLHRSNTTMLKKTGLIKPLIRLHVLKTYCEKEPLKHFAIVIGVFLSIEPEYVIFVVVLHKI